MAAITYLAGPGGSALPAGLRQGSWLTGAGFPDPAVLAGLVAVAVAAAPWLSRPWRRAAWATLLLIGAALAGVRRAAADAGGAGAGRRATVGGSAGGVRSVRCSAIDRAAVTGWAAGSWRFARSLEQQRARLAHKIH